MGADKIQYITAMTVYIGAVVAIGFIMKKQVKAAATTL